MGKIIRCQECAKTYRDVDELEELRDNDSECLVCNAPIEVSDWDRVLASWEEDDSEPDEDDDEDWSEDEDEVEEDDEIGDDDLDAEDFDPDEDLDEDLDEDEEGL